MKTTRSIARRTLLKGAAAAALAPFAPSLALAQKYPDRIVKIIIPFAAGGAVDLVGRPFAQKFGEIIGQSAVIENRPGAGSIIGVMAGAKAPPDGYTLLLTTGSMVATPLMNANAGYDPVKDLVPVTQLVMGGMVLVTHADFPAKNLQELVALAKKNPNKYSFAHTGVGTPPYVAPALFAHEAGIQLVAVPYKGTGNVMSDVIAGQVDMTVASFQSAAEYVKTGKVKAFANTAIKRNAILPEVPTFDELGYKGTDIRGYYGFWVPPGTPQDIITAVYEASAKALKDAELIKTLEGNGLEITSLSPQEFAAFVAKDYERQKEIVKILGLAQKG